MTLTKVNWGIIGCGNVTEVKSGPAFSKIENSELIAVMRRDPDKAADYAERHHIPKYYTDAEKLILDQDINAVYVATPPDTHAYYSIKAMEAGKAVYVEKPMARNYTECKAMISASIHYKVPLFVAYYRRSLPGFLKVKELIETGSIGKVLSFHIHLHKLATNDEIQGKTHWRINPEIAGAGHFFDLASHQLDYFDYLFGPVLQVKGIATNMGGLYDAEDTVSATFSFQNGVTGTGNWCFISSPDNYLDIIEIYGTNGKISFSCFEFTPIVLESDLGKKVFPYEKPMHLQYYLIQNIVNELTGTGKSPSTGESAARSSWVMDEIVKEYYKNKIH